MITREELYELVWSIPGARLAKRIGVSDVYIARVCRKLGVPRPPRGYWRKRAVGATPPTPPLPQWEPGNDRVWSKGKAARQPHRPILATPALRPEGDLGPPNKRQRRPTGTHRLIDDAQKDFETAETRVDGYLKPRSKLFVDIGSSRKALLKSLRFANELFLRLERAGHRVVVASASEELIRLPVDVLEGQDGGREHILTCSPRRPTVAYIYGVPIGLSIIETSETVEMQYVGDGRFIRKSEYRKAEHVGPTWLSKQALPSGRLRLIGYSPFHGIPWSRSWTETTKDLLDSRFEEIVNTLRLGALDLVTSLRKEGRYFS
jgi:hypothetical protein